MVIQKDDEDHIIIESLEVILGMVGPIFSSYVPS